ncbi:MAG: hypothetical protein M1818_000613 [Claussenomyces sp. TS43310]|nr:MAG: hypothetical protein M1818_000613 [Claussenomyces sp. TS43310]
MPSSQARKVAPEKNAAATSSSATSPPRASTPFLDDQNQRLPFTQLITVYLCLAICDFVSFLDASSITTALPSIARSLSAQNSITWAGTSYLIAYAAFQVLYGRLSDVFGRKPILLWSVAMLIFGDILCGFAQNPIWLYICRGLSGIGSGGISSLVQIIISDLVSLRERGKYQGAISAAIGLGAATGPFVSAGLLKTGPEGWRWAFWVPAILAAACIPFLVFLLPTKPITGSWRDKICKIDWLGLGSAVVALLFLLIPVNSAGTIWAWDNAIVISLLVVGSLSLVLFLFTEWKIAKLPLMPLRLFHSPSQAMVLAQSILFGFVWQADLYFLPIYYQEVRQFSPLRSATLILPLLIFQSVTGVLSGPLMSRLTRFRPIMCYGFALWFLGAGLKLLFSRTTSTGVYIAALFIEGAGVGFVVQPTLVALQALSKPEDRAVVTSTRNLLRATGSAFGVAVSTAIEYSVMKSSLPSALPSSLKAQVLDGSWLANSTNFPQWTSSILDARMRGIHAVFISCVPLMGLCLVGCVFVQDRILMSDANPQTDKEVVDPTAKAVV